MLEDVVTEDAPLIESMGFTSDAMDELFRRVNPESLGPDDPDAPTKGGAPDPDPHMDLPDDDSDDDDDGPDLALAGKTRTLTCPSCDHTWEA